MSPVWLTRGSNPCVDARNHAYGVCKHKYATVHVYYSPDGCCACVRCCRTQAQAGEWASKYEAACGEAAAAREHAAACGAAAGAAEQREAAAGARAAELEAALGALQVRGGGVMSAGLHGFQQL